MDEDELREIEAARDYPLFDGVDAQQALALVAEVRRLRAELERWKRSLLTIADDTDDIATYWDICDLIGEQPPSPAPRPRPDAPATSP
jgi:hypothetical protein